MAKLNEYIVTMRWTQQHDDSEYHQQYDLVTAASPDEAVELVATNTKYIPDRATIFAHEIWNSYRMKRRTTWEAQ